MEPYITLIDENIPDIADVLRDIVRKRNDDIDEANNSDGITNLPNSSFIPDTPASGGVLYVQNGSLKYKGSSGTITTLAPA